MWKSQIKPGVQYALREKRDAPFQRVRVLEHVRGGKWKAEWIDPNPGLVHFVESAHLVCAWKDLKALLREQEAQATFKDYNSRIGYETDSAVDNALSSVFESVGDDVSYYRGDLHGSPEALGRVKTRAGMAEAPDSPYAYTDRSKVVHLPFDQAIDIAKRFCAAEPDAVLLSIETTEREWSRQGRTPGEEHIIELLNEYRAAFALIRQWAGLDKAVALREAEIQRLERLVWDAIYALQKAGADREADRLRRAIRRSSAG